MKKRKAALAVGLSLAIGFCSVGLAACGGDDNKGTGGGGGGGTTVTHKPGDRSDWYAAGSFKAADYADATGFKTYKTLDAMPKAMSLLYTDTENQYTITLSLYKEDEFKVIKVGSENPWSPKITGDLLDESITDGFITGGGGMDESDWNFQCNKDGKYTFTFKIGGGKTSVTYTRDADIPALPKPVESIELNQDEVTLELGNPARATFQIEATITPEDADDAEDIEYESDDEDVATVDEDGLVTAVGVGEAEITVTCGDMSATLTVTVINADDAVHATGVELNKSETTLKIGHVTETLTATPQPANTTDTAAWTSSDPTVVSVANGEITALKPGTATITVTYGAGDDAVTDECVVTVLDEYFLAGAFKSVENAGNWNSDWKTATSALAFVQDEEDENVYKLTGVTLMNNDEFKVVFTSMPSNWDGCLGFGAVDDDNDYVSEGGGGNIVVEDAGVYTLTITIEDETATLTFEQTEDLEETWEYDVAFRGNWTDPTGQNWTDIKFSNQTFDKDNKSVTADIELAAANFGVKTCAPGTFDQAAWYNSSVMECAAGVTTITLPQDAGNATCTAAGTYNVTITFNDNGKIIKILFNSFTPAAE